MSQISTKEYKKQLDEFFRKKTFAIKEYSNEAVIRLKPNPELHRYVDRRITETINHYLQRNGKPDNRVLDIGSGYGFKLRHLAEINPLLWFFGFDLSEVPVQEAIRNKFPGLFLIALAESMPFKDSVFQILFASEVIEHIYNQERLIMEMKRVTMKDGIAIISTPNGSAIPSFNLLTRVYNILRPLVKNVKIDNFVEERSYLPNIHLHLNKLKQMFRKYSFKVEHIHFIGKFYFLYAPLGFLLPKNLVKATDRLVISLSQIIEGIPFVNRLFCNQMVFIA
ncbi:class I SAM-dependent methyltransferase [candidate division WOR-3 bacterium]|nr:class I SAM-dependent methyltransferase [candidate division WOR-3 bacterium]